MEYVSASYPGAAPQQVSPAAQDVLICLADAITVPEAMTIARPTGVPLGKSTLQRWPKTVRAKVGTEMPGRGVKSVLLLTRTIGHYEIDRDDYKTWLQVQAPNQQFTPSSAPSRSPKGRDGASCRGP